MVLISIDQFRADYLLRWTDLFRPALEGTRVGGFRYLMEKGAWYSDAHHDHYPLFTGPGHCALATGAWPSQSGIVGNEWGDRATGAPVYCVFDEASPIVGGNGTGVSPRSERVSTIGDELKIATGRVPGREAKVFGIALKDRAAVLMAGHLADGAFWFDETTGRWVSSRYYCRSGTLPAWLRRWNDDADGGKAQRLDAKYGTEWTWPEHVAPGAQARVWLPADEYAEDPVALGKTFAAKRPITGGDPESDKGKRFYRAFATTPLANRYVLDTATTLIDEEHVGADDGAPDFLAINLSSNDYVGHAYGPDSPEVLAMTIETDRALADFMNAVFDRCGGPSKVTFVVTADHGVAPIPQALMDNGLSGGIYDEQKIVLAITEALAAHARPGRGPAPWSGLCTLRECNVYLNTGALSCSEDEATEIAAQVLRRTPGIASAYTRSDILHGRLPPTDVATRVARGYHEAVSGDVVFVAAPGWLPKSTSKTATSHGTPYAYDTSVPILVAGHGVAEPGRYRERVSTLDIAATLADELCVLQPSGCVGKVLPHAGLRPHHAHESAERAAAGGDR